MVICHIFLKVKVYLGLLPVGKCPLTLRLTAVAQVSLVTLWVLFWKRSLVGKRFTCILKGSLFPQIVSSFGAQEPLPLSLMTPQSDLL